MVKSKYAKHWKETQKKVSTILQFKDNFDTGTEANYDNLFSPKIEKRIFSSFIENVHSVLEGAVMTNSNIMILEHHNIVLRKDHLMMNNKVKLVTGGKTGHEPLFLSYVGPGLLTAAVVGSDISPPSAKDIYICLRELANEHNHGIIAIIPNSFEEVVNFGLGIEKARCHNILVDMVTIGDDCWESGNSRFGRRCLAGIILAFKIAGAMSEEGKNMKDIYLALRKLSMGTISSHVSNSAFIGTDLNAGTGMYLPTKNICEVISKMLDYLIDPKKYFSLHVDSNSTFILMVNSYTTERLFLYACVKEILEQLSFREINVVRVYAGTFVSGERGFSITLLNTNKSIQLLRYTDTACSCHFWPRIDARGVPLIVKGPTLPTGAEPLLPMGPFISKLQFIDIPIMYACKALISSEHVLNRLDVNHNFGTSLLPAIKTIMKRCKEKEFPKMHPCNLLNVIGYICQDNIANIHGTLLYIFFLGSAQAFLSYTREVSVKPIMWLEALIRGIDSVKAYTQIDEKDFTFLSVLAPFTCTMKVYLQKKPDDLETMLEDALAIASKLLKNTFDVEAPEKMTGMPEVSAQATLVALTAIVEGIRFVLNQNDKTKHSSEESEISYEETNNQSE